MGFLYCFKYQLFYSRAHVECHANAKECFGGDDFNPPSLWCKNMKSLNISTGEYNRRIVLGEG